MASGSGQKNKPTLQVKKGESVIMSRGNSSNESLNTLDRSQQLLNAKRVIFSNKSQASARPPAASATTIRQQPSSSSTSSSSRPVAEGGGDSADPELGIRPHPGRKLSGPEGNKARRKKIARSLVRRNNTDYEDDQQHQSTDKYSPNRQDNAQDSIQSSWLWKSFVYGSTWLLPTCILKLFLGTKDWRVCYSWREKVAWCMIIFTLCLSVAFLTFGFTTLVCDNSKSIYTFSYFSKTTREKKDQWFLAHGNIYSPYSKRSQTPFDDESYKPFIGWDVSDLFPRHLACTRANIENDFPCFAANGMIQGCYPPEMLTGLHVIAKVAYQWKDMDKSKRFVYSGKVYDILKFHRLLQEEPNFVLFNREIDQLLFSSVGKDATKQMSKLSPSIRACLDDLFLVGRLDVKTMGCLATEIILWVSLIVILSVIVIRFILACWYTWFIARRLGKLKPAIRSYTNAANAQTTNSAQRKPGLTTKYSRSRFMTLPAQNQLPANMQIEGSPFELNSSRSSTLLTTSSTSNRQMNAIGGQDTLVIMLVTCYSEGEASIRTTIDSLACTTYPDSQKLLFIIADGIIKGAGNDQTTPEIILSMMEPYSADEPEPQYCIGLAEGSRRLNMAKVYSGTYLSLDKSHRVPMVVVVKVGTSEESLLPKSGNRGKRDSQIILMSFLSKSLFDDRMTPLEYELHRHIRHYHGVNPAAFEAVLMVDADTFVLPDSLAKMIAVLQGDPKIMGMCGETQIANKGASWVTAIQVYEYYISHHLAKAFESVFGGVTCLPGCFCMYRIKGRRHDGWVPLLANPDIINQYSENRTDTLHRKNLLLLGEDRYLTTLMLKTFTRRKLIFLPAAKCRTFVPDRFGVLLSQRRRWINSTIHNLLELVLVRDLCGTFCFSMQFVVFMELIGSLVLPAAIVFTGVLLVSSFISDPQWVPIGLLIAILGLPAVLILFTTKEIGYLLWLVIYLISLPIWNLVLPLYAFWHFDDFSWGQTRQLEKTKGASGGVGGTNGTDGKNTNENIQGTVKMNEIHGNSYGYFDWTMITMHRWSEYDEMAQQQSSTSTVNQEPTLIDQ